MSLKPILHVHRDRKLLLLTKYAFFMERNRRLELAAERYKKVIDTLSNHRSEILAFALLPPRLLLRFFRKGFPSHFEFRKNHR